MLNNVIGINKKGGDTVPEKNKHVYDKAKYHYYGDFPKKLSWGQAYVHTGMYLGWVIDNDLYSEDFKKESNDLIQAFKERKKTGTQIYMLWDGTLASDMLNNEGNSFSIIYYEKHYFKDYAILFKKLPSAYHVEDNWKNYDRLKKVIDKQYKRWKKSKLK